MDFGYVLKRAWEIIWKFKILWIFGILASCGQASGSGGSNSGFRFSGQDSTVGHQIELYFNQLNPAIITLLIVVGIIIAIAIVVLVVLLGTVGRVGLIRGTMKAEQGAAKLTFSELWRDGLSYFWRVFFLNLLIAVIIVVGGIAAVILATILAVGTLGIFLICLLPLLCLIIPIVWLLSIFIEQANVALVVENLDIMGAINRGWHIFIDNIGSMIVMGLILIIGVSVIGGLIIGLPLLAVATPAVLGISTGIAENIRNGLILSVVLFVIYLPFLLVFSGILRAYTQSAWTLTFLRLTTKPATLPVEPSPAPISEGTPPAPTSEGTPPEQNS